MIKLPQYSILVSALTLAGVGALQAQTVWDGGGVGNDWSTPENWVGDAIPGSGTSAQTTTGGVTIEVTTDVTAARFENQDGSGSLVTLDILSGSLTETVNTFAGRFANGSNTVINVSGGDIFGPNGGDIYGPDAGSSGSLVYNITSGGVYNYTRFRYGNTTVNLTGGVLNMAADGVTGTGISFQNGAALNMSGMGTFVFNVYGNGDNDLLTGGADVDLSGGIIGFKFDAGYTPQIGDSYDFLNTGMVVDGTGANIASSDVDGKYLITWDVSQWGTSAANPSSSKGVLTITDITAIPEPGTYALMVGMLFGGLAILLRRKALP